MASSKQKTFRVSAIVKSWVEVEIKALTLDDALAASKALKADDFVAPVGDIMDQSFRVVGVQADFPDLHE